MYGSEKQCDVLLTKTVGSAVQKHGNHCSKTHDVSKYTDVYMI